MEKETLLTLTTDIVAAHVSNNSVGAADLPQLIESVYGALARTAEPEAPAETTPDPAVSIRSSVKPNSITCLECGARMKMLKRHIGSDHGMTPAEYRARWGLPFTYPMVAPEYSEKRQALAKSIGLGRKPGAKVNGGAPKAGRGRPKKAASTV